MSDLERSIGPFVSVLTAPSRGAIAIVRVWGRGAADAASLAFRPQRGTPLSLSPIGRLRVGRLGAGVGDEVVAVLVDCDGAIEAEIQCHGGPAVVSFVVDAIREAGAAERPAEVWIAERAGSPLRAQAEIDLAFAVTDRTASILLDQANGALDEALDRLCRLIPTDADAALTLLDGLITRADVGLRLRDGWSVAIAGRPNVGKSSLLNALLGFGRAIVSPIPGTTRDVVTSMTSIDGWPVELADTAGLRASSDPIEADGVSKARSRHRGADLVLLVLDGSEALVEADLGLLEAHRGAIVARNKADLPPRWRSDEIRRSSVEVSAVQGSGIDALLVAISGRLVPDPPPPGVAVPFRAAHPRWLRRCRHLLADGRLDGALRVLDRLRKRP